jgi:hypothetical protein
MRPASHRFPAVAVLSACLLASARGAERVEISGGNDGSGQNYQWTVTNRHTSPIVDIVFPHYQADTFIIPEGWKQACTNLAVIGSENLPGECRGYVETPAQGIAPGSTATFGMRLARIGADYRGSRMATVKFADGTQTQVQVVVPVAQSFWQRFLPAIVMGVLLLVAFVLHARRKRQSDAARDAAPLEPT